MTAPKTRPDTDPTDTPAEDVEALPALDHDDDPDSLAGALTDPDVDVDLETAEDEDGGDDDA